MCGEQRPSSTVSFWLMCAMFGLDDTNYLPVAGKGTPDSSRPDVSIRAVEREWSGSTGETSRGLGRVKREDCCEEMVTLLYSVVYQDPWRAGPCYPRAAPDRDKRPHLSSGDGADAAWPIVLQTLELCEPRKLAAAEPSTVGRHFEPNSLHRFRLRVGCNWGSLIRWQRAHRPRPLRPRSTWRASGRSTRRPHIINHALRQWASCELDAPGVGEAVARRWGDSRPGGLLAWVSDLGSARRVSQGRHLHHWPAPCFSPARRPHQAGVGPILGRRGCKTARGAGGGQFGQGGVSGKGRIGAKVAGKMSQKRMLLLIETRFASLPRRNVARTRWGPLSVAIARSKFSRLGATPALQKARRPTLCFSPPPSPSDIRLLLPASYSTVPTCFTSVRTVL